MSAMPTLVCILHPQNTPHHHQYVSSIPSMHPSVRNPASPVCILHPKAWARPGTAPTLTGAPGTKGLGGISQFFPST